MQVEFEDKIIYFLKNLRSRKMFSAYNKIKGNLQKLPEKVNMQFIKYYQTGMIYDKLYLDEVCQIDITSAYSSILRNSGLITDEVYDYLCTLDKLDRLACVGMLASKKNIFTFNDKGLLESHSVVANKYSDYFFYCVQKTYKIMNECRLLLGEDFLFSWVDAIYFNPSSTKAKIVQDYLLESFNLKSTVSTLKEFEVEMKKEYYRLRYSKKGKKTFMNIPTSEQIDSKIILNYLLKHKHNIKTVKEDSVMNNYLLKQKTNNNENNQNQIQQI